MVEDSRRWYLLIHRLRPPSTVFDPSSTVFDGLRPKGWNPGGETVIQSGMRNQIPFQTILAGAAIRGRPLFVRMGHWPRGQWVAIERRSGWVVIGGQRTTPPAQDHWRSDSGTDRPAASPADRQEVA